MNELEEKMRQRLKHNSFMNYNHMELEFVEPDHAVFKLDIREESRNPFGMVHGGAIYSLADNATGSAAHSDGRAYVTQSGALNFLNNQPEGTLRADARVRHRGKTTCLIDVDVTGDGGKLIATGEFTYFCVDKGRMDEKVKQA